MDSGSSGHGRSNIFIKSAIATAIYETVALKSFRF